MISTIVGFKLTISRRKSN